MSTSSSWSRCLERAGDPEGVRHHRGDGGGDRAAGLRPGLYNLFLAVGVGAGVLLVVVGSDAGVPLLVFGCGSMLAAALVLLLTDRTKARAALVQGALPAVALLALLGHSIAS